ncbi:MAG: 3-deoxy-manno-octulosonate cytidylyltransferase [Lentisphaeria bacterium]|nr:3-deoxy-manno-octulosonate cytidylyltransferase [Lentisphaeria bacterium]
MNDSSQRVVAVIPARYASTRFPGKPLVPILRKPMIEWVYERTAATAVDEVLVATDDERIAECVERFGGRCVMTSPDHPTGTDRIAEVARNLDTHWILNVQGDEPLIPSDVLDQLIARMRGQGQSEMGTVAVPIQHDDPEFTDPNIVKVVVDAAGNAMYFSRSGIPCDRDGGADVQALAHWGIYMYTADLLQRFVKWPQGQLERCERLEQLRAMENGVRIQVLVGRGRCLGVDTPEDVARAEALLQAEES